MPSEERHPNERLRAAIIARGLQPRALAEHVGVDAKTIERWVETGRVPHARNRLATARALGEDEGYLWADPLPSARSFQVSQAEVVAIYPHRSDVPAQLWWSLFTSAVEQIGILVYAGVFLYEQHPELAELLKQKASSGCQVRIALGDRTSDAVRVRGEEERYGEGIDSRVRVAIRHLDPVHHGSPAEVRLHRTTLYNSIYRFDDQLLVNLHLWATNAYEAPVLHLRRVQGGKLFDMYARNFEMVWGTAAPLTSDV
jgi:transcriptional regulator with XRE-family HTH domain